MSDLLHDQTRSLFAVPVVSSVTAQPKQQVTPLTQQPKHAEGQQTSSATAALQTVMRIMNIVIVYFTLTVTWQALCYKPEGRGFDTRWADFF
jgi:hypothetical protein